MASIGIADKETLESVKQDTQLILSRPQPTSKDSFSKMISITRGIRNQYVFNSHDQTGIKVFNDRDTAYKGDLTKLIATPLVLYDVIGSGRLNNIELLGKDNNSGVETRYFSDNYYTDYRSNGLRYVFRFTIDGVVKIFDTYKLKGELFNGVFQICSQGALYLGLNSIENINTIKTEIEFNESLKVELFASMYQTGEPRLASWRYSNRFYTVCDLF